MSEINIGGRKITINSNYSTEEQFTGQHWVDGKPIYMRTIVDNSAHTKSANTLLDLTNDLTNWNIYRIIGYAGNVYRDDFGYLIPQTIHSDNGTSVLLAYQPLYYYTTKILHFRITGSIAANIQSYCLVVYYTKTTD